MWPPDARMNPVPRIILSGIFFNPCLLLLKLLWIGFVLTLCKWVDTGCKLLSVELPISVGRVPISLGSTCWTPPIKTNWKWSYCPNILLSLLFASLIWLPLWCKGELALLMNILLSTFYNMLTVIDPSDTSVLNNFDFPISTFSVLWVRMTFQNYVWCPNEFHPVHHNTICTSSSKTSFLLLESQQKVLKLG